MAEKLLLDRALCKRIKGMNKEEMSKFLEEIYMMGVEDSTIDIDILRDRIGQIKGIGAVRLDEIMEVIEDSITGNSRKT